MFILVKDNLGGGHVLQALKVDIKAKLLDEAAEVDHLLELDDKELMKHDEHEQAVTRVRAEIQ